MAKTSESPGSGVRTVDRLPNISPVPAAEDTVSAKNRPEITAEDENGPKVIAALLDAEPTLPVVVIAAANPAVCRT